MASLKQIRERFASLQGSETQLFAAAMDEQDENILALNRLQMFDGKTKTGENISPTYLDDPYFKTRESAQRYSDWKDRITPNPNRVSGVPNLYINGMFHNSVDVRVDVRGLNFESDFYAKKDISEKFENIYGLNSDYREKLSKTVYPLFFSKIRQFLKL